MLSMLVDGYLIIMIIFIEFASAIFIALFIQFIVYQITGFSIYNYMCKILKLYK